MKIESPRIALIVEMKLGESCQRGCKMYQVLAGNSMVLGMLRAILCRQCLSLKT